MIPRVDRGGPQQVTRYEEQKNECADGVPGSPVHLDVAESLLRHLRRDEKWIQEAKSSLRGRKLRCRLSLQFDLLLARVVVVGKRLADQRFRLAQVRRDSAVR